MLLASLAIAFLTGPQSAPPTEDGAGKVWDNLDVMRRMLVRQIGAKHDAISAAPKPADEAEVVTRDGKLVSRNKAGGGVGYVLPDNVPEKSAGDDSVAGEFLRTRNNSWLSFENAIGSESEYVPGLAAIFSLSVPVKVRVVTVEPKAPEAKKPAEAKNSDDEAWDKLARGGDDPVDRHVKTLLGQGGKGSDEPQRELKFDDAALKALKETVVDTVARFGGRVGLAHGERLAVVVKLQVGRIVNDGDDSPRKGEVHTGDNVVEYYDATGGRNPDSFGNAMVYANGRLGSVARRIVLQVSADDLRAFKSGDLDRDDLVKKMRLEEFTVPTGANAGNNPFNWTGSRGAR
jgi:hypothetical protein